LHSFHTAAMKNQLNEATSDDGSEPPVASFRSPEVTESKIARIERMAADENPKIRESAALSYHAPEHVYFALAEDTDAEVRACLARNSKAPCEVLRILSGDKSEKVRAFVATNFHVPADVMEVLAQDQSELVRQLVAWKNGLRQSTLVPS